MASCPNYSELSNGRMSNFVLFSKSLQSLFIRSAMKCREDSLSYSTVRRWVNLSWEGRASVQDAPRPGAPKLATNSEIKEYSDSFPHSSVEDVANNVGISTGSAHAILKSESWN